MRAPNPIVSLGKACEGRKNGGGQGARAIVVRAFGELSRAASCPEDPGQGMHCASRWFHSPRMGNAGRVPAPRGPGILPG